MESAYNNLTNCKLENEEWLSVKISKKLQFSIFISKEKELLFITNNFI